MSTFPLKRRDSKAPSYGEYVNYYAALWFPVYLSSSSESPDFKTYKSTLWIPVS